MTLRFKKRGEKRWERALRSDAAAQGSSEKVEQSTRDARFRKLSPRAKRAIPNFINITVINPGGVQDPFAVMSWVGDLILIHSRLSLFRDTDGSTRKGIRTIQCGTSNRKLPKIA